MGELKLFLDTTVRNHVVEAIDERVTAIIDERVPRIIDEQVPPMIEGRVTAIVRASEARIIELIADQTNQLVEVINDAHDEDFSKANKHLQNHERRITRLERWAA